MQKKQKGRNQIATTSFSAPVNTTSSCTLEKKHLIPFSTYLTMNWHLAMLMKASRTFWTTSVVLSGRYE